MKKRIVALILTVVMSLMVLTSCGSYDFTKEDLDAYASFDYAAFRTALNAIKVKEGDFTNDPDKRVEYIEDKIYNAVADKLIANATDAEKLEEGVLGAGDALYFVYKAVDAATGNVFYTSQMQVTTLTGSNKADHVIKLGDVDEDKDFMVELSKALAEKKDVDIKDYIYSALFASDIKADAEAAYKEANPDATAEKITEAGNAALKVTGEHTIVVSYTYTTGEGESLQTMTASYETIDLSKADHILASYILAEKSVANVGENLKVFDKVGEDGKDVTTEKFDVTVTDADGNKEVRTYSNVKILYRLDNEKELVSFKYTPFAKDSTDSKAEISADNLHKKDEKVKLAGVELTYYVYPVYRIALPAYSDITASDILTYAIGSSLRSTSLKVLADESYKNGDKTVKELVDGVAKAYATTANADDTFYTETYKDLKAALDKYNNLGGSKPSTEQKAENAKALEVLNAERLKTLKDIVAKVLACTNGTETVESVVKTQYYDSQFHTAEVAFDNDIVTQVRKAVWDLIDKSVVIKTDANGNKQYPEKLVKEFSKHILEEKEETYYTGKTGEKANVDIYDTFEAYLQTGVYKVSNMDEVNAKVKAEAEAQIDPMIKIFVVAKAISDNEANLSETLKSYNQKDIENKLHNTTADERNEDKIEILTAMESYFLVDDAYMKAYKKAIGRANYKYLVSENGELNVRVAHQYDKLMSYLTGYEVEFNTDTNKVEPLSKDGFVQFREVKYVFETESSDK